MLFYPTKHLNFFSSQFLVHRCLCLDSLRKGQISLYLNLLGQVILFVIVSLIGLILYTYYHDCDPVLAGVVTSQDAIVPIFVLQEFATIYGVPGEFKITMMRFTKSAFWCLLNTSTQEYQNMIFLQLRHIR